MRTTLLAVETICPSAAALHKQNSELTHELTIEIPEFLHPTQAEDDQILIEYDGGAFPLFSLLCSRGGVPALALWDVDTYKEWDYLLPVVEDKIISENIG